MSKLLARHAEAFFWLARYQERLQSLGRVLDVHESFNRDSRGEVDWRSLLALFADEAEFAARHGAPDRRNVVGFYLLDREHSGSIVSSLRMARENARALRPLLATSVWAQLTQFSAYVNGLGAQDLDVGKLTLTCRRVVELAQTHLGIVETTMQRDEGYGFYQLGQMLERADQTTRLLDVRHQNLLRGDLDGDSPALEASQWNLLLRSLDGYHAYRRTHPTVLDRATVARYLLLDHAFPRSVGFCLDRLDAVLQELRRTYSLRGANAALAGLDDLADLLRPDSVRRRVGEDLHGLNDQLQLRLAGLSETLGRAFFGHAAPEPAEPRPAEARAPGQSQRQIA